MDGMGLLMGMLAGDKNAQMMRNQNLQDQSIAYKQQQDAIKNQQAQELLQRAHPLITEQASQLGDVRKQGPQSLEDLLMFHGQDTPEQIKSKIGLTDAQSSLIPSEIFKNFALGQAASENADTKQNSGGKGNAKMQELTGHANTLLDQLNNFKKETNNIPAYGFGTGSVMKLLGKTGAVPWSGDQATAEGRITPIIDTYVKMTAGRANKEILDQMKNSLQDIETSPASIREGKMKGLVSFLQSDLINNANAYGIDPSTIPQFFSTTGMGNENKPSIGKPTTTRLTPSSSPITVPARQTGPNSFSNMPDSSSTPSGATHIVMGSDGKKHYTDGKNDLGVAQ